MSRYREPPKGVSEYIVDNQQRVSKLERAPQLSSASISDGFIQVNGGSITIFPSDTDLSDPDKFSRVVQLGGDDIKNGEPVASLLMMSEGFTNFGFDPDQQTLRFWITTYSGTTTPSWQFNDKMGNPVISDSNNGLGMSEPRMSITWYDPANFKTFTSSTFANLASTFWYMYHPNLKVRCVIQADVGTTGEIRVIENGHDQQAGAVIASGANQFVDLIVDRANLSQGQTPNGNQTPLDVEVRRTSGAGNVKALIVDMIAMDFS